MSGCGGGYERSRGGTSYGGGGGSYNSGKNQSNSLGVDEGHGKVIITASDRSIVDVNASWVNITGFKITNSSTDKGESGIALHQADHCKIQDISFSNNYHGISLGSSDNTNITNNNMDECGIYLKGSMLSHWNTHSIDTSNTINGRPVHYWRNKESGTVPAGAGQVILANCTGVTVENQNITNVSGAIILGFSSDNNISNNNLSYNDRGIVLSSISTGNELEGNIITKNNSQYGLFIEGNSSFDNDIRITNTVNGIPLRWYTRDSDVSLDGLNVSLEGITNVCQVMLYHCQRMVISNSTITNGPVGIVIRNSDRSGISNSTISGYVEGIRSESSHGNSFVGNELKKGFGYCINIASSDNNIIDNNTFSGNGMNLFLSENNTIANNTCSNNDIGIHIGYSGNNRIENNDMDNSTLYGLYINSSDNDIIRGNGLSHNGYGMYLVDFSNGEMDNNSIDNNSVAGIFIDSGSLNVLSNSTCSHNEEGMITGPAAYDNTIDNCTIVGNSNNGVLLGSSYGNTIKNNTISGNEYGIHDSSRKMLFFDNFEDGTLSPWSKSGSGIIGVYSHTSNGSKNSLYICRNSVYATSGTIDLAGYAPVHLDCWIRKGDDSFSNQPEVGEDLKIQYRDSGNSWHDLATFYGGGAGGEINVISLGLPADALHSSFRLRFHQTAGSGGNQDYWHVDDVRIYRAETGPEYNNNTIEGNKIYNNDHGIYLEGSRGDVIRSNEIYAGGGKTGLTLHFTRYTTVRDNDLHDLKHGMEVEYSDHNSLERNTVARTTDNGIDIVDSTCNVMDSNSLDSNDPSGIRLRQSCGNELIDNTCNSGNSHGIYLDHSVNCILRANTCELNGDNGLYVYYSDDTVCENNTLTSNNDHGIYSYTSPRYSINNNTVRSNAKHGIYLYQSSYGSLLKNKCEENNDHGIYSCQSGNTRVINNTCRSNVDHGIFFDRSKDCVINSNICVLNGDHGLYISDCDNSMANNNNCTSNSGSGLYLVASDNTPVKNNTGHSNSGHGIYMYNSDYCDIENNSCKNDQIGIYVINSQHNNVKNNSCDHDGYGIYMSNSHQMSLINNTCTFNTCDGIATSSSNNNEFFRNNCSNNVEDGFVLSTSSSNRIHNNTGSNNGLRGLLITDAHDNQILDNVMINNSGNGIAIYNSQRTKVTRNRCSMNNYALNLRSSKNVEAYRNQFNHNLRGGLFLHNSDSNNIYNNTVNKNNECGINSTRDSDSNSFHDNIFIENGGCAILFENDCGSTEIHHNNFIRNNPGGMQVSDLGPNNVWDDGQGEGNFWSDHSIRYPVAGNDGSTWDAPYVFDANEDEHPLMFVTFPDPERPVFVKDESGNTSSTGDEFTFGVNVTDDIAVICAWASYTYDNVVFDNLSLVYRENDLWTNSTPVSPNSTFLNYYFTVLDAGGNRVRFDGTDLPVTDDDPPLFMVRLTAEPPTTGDVYDLVFHLDDNIGISSAHINYTFDGVQYRNESLSSPTPSQWTIPINVPGWAVNFSYQLFLRDTSGNRNSTPVENITVIDDDLPFVIRDNTTSPSTGDGILFSAEFHDNVNVSRAEVEISYDGTAFHSRGLTRSDGDRWSLAYRVEPRVSFIYYRFVVADPSNNILRTRSVRLPVEDNDPPVLLADLTSRNATTGDNLTFSLRVSDNIGLSSVRVVYTFDELTYHNETMDSRSGILWELTVRVADTAEKVGYVFHFEDGGSNRVSSERTVIPVADNDAPEFEREVREGPPRTGLKYTFRAIIRDNSEVALVRVEYSFDGRDTGELHLGHDDGSWTGKVTIPLDSGFIEYLYMYTDELGNGDASARIRRDITDIVYPLADAGDRKFVEKGAEVTFNGTASTDNIGVTSHTWDFIYNGHPVHLHGAKPSFAFLIPGNYTVLLTLTDDAGNTASNTVITFINDTCEAMDEPDGPSPGPGPDPGDDDDDDDTDPDNDSDRDKAKSSIFSSLYLIIPFVLLVLIVIVGACVIFLFKRKPAPGRRKPRTGPGDDKLHLQQAEAEPVVDSLPIFPERQFMEPLRYTLPENSHYTHEGTVLVTEPMPSLKVTGQVREEQKALPPASFDTAAEGSGDVPEAETALEYPGDTRGNRKEPDAAGIGSPGVLPPPPDILEDRTSSGIVRVHVTEPIPPSPGDVVESPEERKLTSEEQALLHMNRMARKRRMYSPISRLVLQKVMLFRLEESMPCSICYGDITAGLQAIRCSCGNISHLSCGIKAGKCPECGTECEAVMDQASEEAILSSIEDSDRTAKREVEEVVEWNEKDDMVKALLKQVINREITIEEYKMLVNDIRENF